LRLSSFGKLLEPLDPFWVTTYAEKSQLLMTFATGKAVPCKANVAAGMTLFPEGACDSCKQTPERLSPAGRPAV
jgi:hypothetical protein